MSRRSGARTYWCMDCNMYAVPGPYRQCPECEGEDTSSWDAHIATLATYHEPLTRHWPEPARPTARVAPPIKLIPRSVNEVTYHARVTP